MVNRVLKMKNQKGSKRWEKHQDEIMQSVILFHLCVREMKGNPTTSDGLEDHATRYLMIFFLDIYPSSGGTNI